MNEITDNTTAIPFDRLAREMEGELYDNMSWRLLYATDASVFREVPAAVCCPAGTEDLKKILAFCTEQGLPMIPRTAGTSLAGQVVGHGLVVDFSRHMNRILELNTEERWVKVQPGVILDDLNRFLEPHGLFFGPETSTGNRCMIGGMVANNSCGSHSLVYGSTRDHTLEISALLSDGSEVLFGPMHQEEFREKCTGHKLENKIYKHVFEMLSNKGNQEEIRAQYPDPRINRRNTGYALDLLLNAEVFDGKEPFNFCKLLCGSEGTLALSLEIKLSLVELPPPEKALVCVHTESIQEALQANLVALKHGPVAVELIDRVILDCTRSNITQARNRFFIKGDPGAILVVEFACNNRSEGEEKAAAMEAEMHKEHLGYHYPLLFGGDINKVWALRKAGLGLLSNLPGDAKPVAVIEDTAVHPDMLPGFIKELQVLLDKLGLRCVFYAHIGTGELHLRPVLNLKNHTDVERFHQVAKETALLIKKYRGSLSGEHGDGRLRGEFIPLVLGEKNTRLLQEIKTTWDPRGLFNPEKIIHTPSIKTSLRYAPGQPEKKINTYFDFQDTRGFLRAVEKCNGSGDCLKPSAAGGVMCPSYQATREEPHSTRGRANILREFVTNSPKKNPFDHKEIMEVLDLCLSCKGCKSECPSSVDMGKYKAEALQHYYETNGTPLQARVTGAYAKLNRVGSLFPAIYNFFAKNRLTSGAIKHFLGFSPKRNLPLLQSSTLRKWALMHLSGLNNLNRDGKEVIVFCDEFTNYNDTGTGISTIMLLHRLGYRVTMPNHGESGRTYLSKGLLKQAAKRAAKNVEALHPLVSADKPLVGIEPSALLCFRDEYALLLEGEIREKAISLASHAYTLDEFIAGEIRSGHISSGAFTDTPRKIYLHGHCHQKALSSVSSTVQMLSVLPHTEIREIECGCCGMAGAFGFEKNHYELSMQIGELSLFPAIRQAEKDAIIAAPGTSCRQQIHDGTGRVALHPADILFLALK